MQPGTKVKMSESLKNKLLVNGCANHAAEFGDCVGTVEKLIGDWPEVEVRWQPSGLRYGYLANELTVIKQEATSPPDIPSPSDS